MAEVGTFIERVEGGACTDTHAEDYVDHVWDYYGTDDECVTITHFWDPDLGPGDIMWTALCSGENAAWKAQVLWGMALGEYNSGDKSEAYHYLGHIAHLLADMSVPTHAHDDSHVYPDTFDDEYMDQPGGCGPDGGPPECLTATEKVSLRAQGLVVIPSDITMLPLHYLFYTTAQLAGIYASDDVDGNTDLDPGAQVSVDFGAFDPGNGCDDADVILSDDWDEAGSESNLCMQVIRNNSYLRSIRAVAALYKLFAETVRRQAELTVVVDKIQQIEGHGDAPDYFVRVKIGDFWHRNEGSQVGDADYSEIPVGWAFARDVGSTGVVDVWVELWDDDVGGYDKSDIYSGPNEAPDAEERAIWLRVDLEKCRAGAVDAIGYDLTGACRYQLTSAGDDPDRSQIWLTILPPNSPPEAHAGVDQTVDEGDPVTLDGTFTDPDVDDTHTFSWHLVSSTNGQPVPDSTTQTLSFTPWDNGVYTFTFTVTDNHGAQGSDTVVVTALNVPPVVGAPRISSQPNAEFILPVVHQVAFEGSFTDAGVADTHTAVWDWGDGTTSDGGVTEANGSGSVAGSHTYALPGDYMITLTVTDDDGGSGSNTMSVHIVDAAEALTIFNAYIQSLPAGVFKNNASQRKNAFDNMFSELARKLANKAYQGLVMSMNSSLRIKFDGLAGGSPSDDWIVRDLAIQEELCQKVDDITAYLNHLLSTQP